MPETHTQEVPPGGRAQQGELREVRSAQRAGCDQPAQSSRPPTRGYPRPPLLADPKRTRRVWNQTDLGSSLVSAVLFGQVVQPLTVSGSSSVACEF